MISVCIATYNGELFIKKQLLTILSQLSIEDEIIISDDGSTDRTIAIVNSINDNRIKIFNHEKSEIKHRSANHIYTSKNFENALKNVNGDYIFLADQDDLWAGEKIAKMIKSLSENDNILVASNFSVIDTNDNIIDRLFFKKKPIKKYFFSNLIRTPFFGCSMGFKRELLKYILPFPKNLILHDNWIGFIALHYGHVEYINEPLILYRRHQNNVSQDKGKSNNPIWYKIFYRINLFIQYQKRINHIS